MSYDLSQVAAPSILHAAANWQQDEANNLGNANGNSYVRRPGNAAHDGQIMIRFKQRRVVLIDYGYVPTEQDFEIAKAVPNVCIPRGAGTAICKEHGCDKIGVPVCLHDSAPNEAMCLYLRSGLCFGCQRKLNEKRRTKKKRKDQPSAAGQGQPMKLEPPVLSGNVSASGTVEINATNIVINGAVGGAQYRGPHYGCQHIGPDVLQTVSELAHQTNTLVATGGVGAPTQDIDRLYEAALVSASKAAFLLSQWRASYDEQMTSGPQGFSPKKPKKAKGGSTGQHAPADFYAAPNLNPPVFREI